MKYFQTAYDRKHGNTPLWWGKRIIFNKGTGLHYAFFSDNLFISISTTTCDDFNIGIERLVISFYCLINATLQ